MGMFHISSGYLSDAFVPATLLLVEVKGRWTEAEFEVGQPRGADVNRRGHSSRAQPDEEHADPSGPSIMRALE